MQQISTGIQPGLARDAKSIKKNGQRVPYISELMNHWRFRGTKAPFHVLYGSATCQKDSKGLTVVL